MRNETWETSVVADCLVSLCLNINDDACFFLVSGDVQITLFMYIRETQKCLVRLGAVQSVPWIGLSSYMIDASVMWQLLHIWMFLNITDF